MSECKCEKEQDTAPAPKPEGKPLEVCDNCKAVLAISKSEFLTRIEHIWARIDTGYYKRAKNGLESLKDQVL